MITIYSEKEEVRNNAIPQEITCGMESESIISSSLIEMRKMVKKNLREIKDIDWEK